MTGPIVSEAAPSGLPQTSIEPRPHEKPLPINLATALRLSSARPLIIAAAQASEEVAAAELDLAKVLWLPNINLGGSWYGHVGGAQGNAGTLFNNTRNQEMLGAGASAIVSTTDAVFTPLAARQVVRPATWSCKRPATTRCSWPRPTSTCSRRAAG